MACPVKMDLNLLARKFCFTYVLECLVDSTDLSLLSRKYFKETKSATLNIFRKKIFSF